MTDNERLKQAFMYTKNQRYVRNQQDFTERLGIDKASMSQMINGHRSVANEVFAKIANTFPFFSINWLLTGEGEMLKPTEGVAPRDAVPLEDVVRQGNTDNTLDRLLTMMERLIEQGDRQTRVAEINAEANKQNSDNLARLIERWDAMQGNSLSRRQSVG